MDDIERLNEEGLGQFAKVTIRALMWHMLSGDAARRGPNEARWIVAQVGQLASPTGPLPSLEQRAVLRPYVCRFREHVSNQIDAEVLAEDRTDRLVDMLAHIDAVLKSFFTPASAVATP